jgi:hypothetical protein
MLCWCLNSKLVRAFCARGNSVGLLTLKGKKLNCSEISRRLVKY